MMKKFYSANSSRYMAAVAVALLLLAWAAGGATLPVAHTNGYDVSIKNFGKVNDNYYRGSQPVQLEFEQLKRLGIKTVIDLRKDSMPQEPAWVRGLGMQYFNIPMKPSRPATEEQTSYFLSLVNNPANWPVFVHCEGGRHRTGALTAIYRITHDGWTADRAYKEMKEYDFESGFFGGPTAQKKYVYAFYERYKTEQAKVKAK